MQVGAAEEMVNEAAWILAVVSTRKEHMKKKVS